MRFDELADGPEDTEYSPAERIAATSRSTWVSVGVNVILTIAQVVVGVLAKSQGLIADGIHSLSDLVADFVVLLASHHSNKDADVGHPYGHHRFETAASLVLGTLLLVVGVGMLWSAVRKLEAPETIQTVHVIALWVAGGALIAKELLFRYMLSVAKRVKSSVLVGQCLACTLRCRLIAGGGYRDYWEPCRLPDSGSDCRAYCGLHGRQDGLELQLGCAARSDGPCGE